MRALVTGGAGFVGSHLVDVLVESGQAVTVLLRPGEDARQLPLGSGRVRTVEGDVRDAAAVEAAIEGTTSVFHLAARTDLAGASLADYDVNTRGTEMVLAAARRAGCRRFVFVSSMLAVGLTGRKDPIDERSTQEPLSQYGKSKRLAEELVRRSAIPFAIIRPTLVYGPRERSTMQAFLKAVYRRRFVLIGDDVLQSFVYVKNLAHAIHRASEDGGAAGGTFFVSDERPYSLHEFAASAARALGVRLLPFRLPVSVALAAGLACDAIARVIGRELPLSVRRVRTMTTNYVYSIEAARRALGYEPRWRIEDALQETARWYLERGLL